MFTRTQIARRRNQLAARDDSPARKDFYSRRGAVQCCRECYRWLPDMDLGLAPAKPYRWTPGYLEFGTTQRAVEAALRAPAASVVGA